MRNRGGKHSTAVTYGNHQIAVPCRLLSEIKERTHHMSLTWVAHALQQTPRRMERRATGWDKVCAHHTSNSELASKTTQRTLKTLGKKTNSPASKWTKDVTRNLTADAQTVNKHMKNIHPPHWSPRSCSLNNNDELLPQIQSQSWPWQLLARMGSCRKSSYSSWPWM